jgi:hypothetical protein
MKKSLTIMLAIGIFWTLGLGQAFRLTKPALNEDNTYAGLPSNSATGIIAQGDSLMWFATGGGLSFTNDFGASFVSLYSGLNNLPHGGISAMAVKGDTIWVAAVFDSLIKNVGELQVGGWSGLFYRSG